MSVSNSTPPQDPTPDSISPVTRKAPACAREHTLEPAANRTIPVWILALGGIALIVAGGILGGAGKKLSYGSGNTFLPGYVRTPAPGAVDEGPKPKEALVALMARGEKIFAAKCIACHGPEAKGDGVNFPSLVGSKWALGETERFAMIILNGLQGPTSTGKAYGAGMPTQAAGMAPEDLAGVMTYVRNHFGNATNDVVTVPMAKAAFEISAARPKAGQQVTGQELETDHLKNLPGDPLDPKAPVNPVTLLPVKK